MCSTIIVLGKISLIDKAILEKTAASQDFCLEFKYRIEDLESFSTLPSGFISFFPCIMENIISQFACLPIGTGEKIPFYQMVKSDGVPEFLSKFPVIGVFESPLSAAAAYSIVTAISRNVAVNLQNSSLIKELMNHRKQKFQLVQIGTALSRENDLNQLLEIILTASRQIVSADAGCIYVRERKVPGGPFLDSLIFMVSQNDSVPIADMPEAAKISIPIDENSVAGYVAKNGKIVNVGNDTTGDIPLLYRSIGNESKEKIGYHIKTMLTLPLKNMEGEVVGVLQLINKKKDLSKKLTDYFLVEAQAVNFLQSDEEFVQSVASQAAVSIERVQLHESIHALFEGFLDSSIASIDERDKVTSGHSRRVMGYATAFAEAAALEPDSPFAAISNTPDRKRQFEFAALLHDIGKIGVPEYLLTKESRLSECELQSIFLRMEIIALQLKYSISSDSWKNFEELCDDKKFLNKINFSGNLSENDLAVLTVIKNKMYVNLNGEKKSFLTDREFESLSVRFGNLTSEERQIINSHAQSTLRILSKIPWPRQLEQVPLIAAQHHEKLDGSGYPDGVKNEDIILESKVLAVIDIYEALVSQNRPYKPKMSPEEALTILKIEAEKGRLDMQIIQFFIDKEIFKIYLTD
jgi:HD-GYP domain-containing protein (c-di-GMP phosphodiesterase class II)